MMQEIILKGEQLFLLPERAVWWPAQRALILSDLHWGKSAHFRKNGIPMPGSTQEQDALRLSGIVRQHQADQLIIAGDLFHSRHNSEVENFRRWRDAHEDLQIHFIMGNHDILPAPFYESLRFEVHQECLSVEPFLITHDATAHESFYGIHGHLHPGLPLAGLGVSSRSMPCFCIGKNAMILPAFGKFTGCKKINTTDFEHIYIIGEKKVLQLK